MPGAMRRSRRSRNRSRSPAGDEAQRLFFAQHSRIGGPEFGQALTDVAEQGGAVHDVECFFERLQILHADHYGGRMAVLGNDHAAMFSFQAIDDLGEPILDVREGHLLSDGHGYKCS